MNPNQSSQQADQKEAEWIHVNPRFAGYGDYPMAGELVEFVTEFGVTHMGMTVNASAKNRRRDSYSVSHIIFMSEDTDQPEFFTLSQLKQWRITDTKVKKKRLLGKTTPEGLRVSGILTPIFLNYLGLRMNERRSEVSHFLPETKYFENEEGKNQWETSIYHRGGSITLTEVDGIDFMLITTDGNMPKNHPLLDTVNQYHYKEVARACERICDYILGENFL